VVVAMRRWWALSIAAVAFLAAAGVCGLGGIAAAASTTLFSSDAQALSPGFYPSAATVPTGICFVTVIADGGHGGANSSASHGGGPAASVTARVPVTPGSTLAVELGDVGASGTDRKSTRLNSSH